jgi:hypothetical protein
MKPIKHHTNNAAAGSLPLTKQQHEGQNVLLSFWKPTPEEIQSLLTGALVVMMVQGDAMPTVSLAAVKA